MPTGVDPNARRALKSATQIQLAASMSPTNAMTDIAATEPLNDLVDLVRLSKADQECLAQALLTPPEPTAALQRAIAARERPLRVRLVIDFACDFGISHHL